MPTQGMFLIFNYAKEGKASMILSHLTDDLLFYFFKGKSIDTITQSTWFGSIGKYMTEVRITDIAKYFYSYHTETAIFMVGHDVLLYWLCKRRPAGTTFEFHVSIK